MNKWPRCEDCVRDNYLRAPVCQTCVAGSNFLPRGRSKIYYESVQEMNQPPAAYRAMVQALRRFDDMMNLDKPNRLCAKSAAPIMEGGC